MTVPSSDTPGQAPDTLLFAEGPFGPRVDEWRQTTAKLLADVFAEHAAAAERAGLFPRRIIADIGSTGLFHERWRTGLHGDPGRGVVIAEESGRLGHASLSVGLSLHLETVSSVLIRYGDSSLLREYLAGVLDGRLVGCLGASEPTGGSDLTGIRTTARKVPGGWRVTGEKKYLSLGRVCDFALLLCRIDDGSAADGRLGVFAVPASGLTPKRRLAKAGTAALDTTWMTVDVEVPDEARVGRVGAGLLVATWGLSHERLSIAGQAVGGIGRAIALATAHLHRRHQFGRPLMEHQALRLRLAELASRLLTLRYAVYAAGQGLPVTGAVGPRDTAALKVTAARFAEEAISECMHLFGGPGYLEDETPLARMWRDARLARLGGGTDEMMWELVASGLVPDFEAYDESVDVG
ncbi:acyl-CoA dehydrogenase family protein [Streptomyces sp. NPDC001770]